MIKALATWKRKDVLERVTKNVSPHSAPDISLVLEIANSFSLLNDNARAEEWYEGAKKLCPNNYWVYYWYARHHERAGNNRDALACLHVGLWACRDRVLAQEWESLTSEAVRLTLLGERADRWYARQILEKHGFEGPPATTALYVCMAKNEEDIIGASLEAAYKAGFRNFAIINNDSRDTTEEKISEFSSNKHDAVLLYIKDPTIAYYQASKMNAFWHFGVEYFAIRGQKIDWIFPTDADEFWLQLDAEKPLSRILDSYSGSDVTTLISMWCTATAKTVKERSEPSSNVSELFGVVSGYDTAPSVKVAIRADRNTSFMMGNHHAAGSIFSMDNIANINSQGFFMYHFPIRSAEQYRSKIIQGNAALNAAKDLEPGKGGHWREQFSDYTREGDEFIRNTIERFILMNKANQELLRKYA